MKRIAIFFCLYFSSISLFAFENDSTKTLSNSPTFYNSINVLLGGGNKNYHDDSFYSVALRYESRSEYMNFAFEVEHMINTEKGYASCVSGEREHYDKNYNTIYFSPRWGMRYKYIGFEIGGSIVNQTRGWCENILENGYAFFGRLNFGILDKYYFSVGNSDNFRITLHYEIFEMSATYLFDQGLSSIRLESMISRGDWGFGLIIKKNINEKFIAIGELYSFDEIQITRSERTSEVFNIRVGVGYLISNL